MLANVFDVSDVSWFGRWEARDDLAGIRSPTLVLMGDRTWDGRTIDPADDGSLTLMRERVPGLEVRLIADAHPGYVAVQKPGEFGGAARVPRAPPPQLTRGSACSSGGLSPSATSAKCCVAGSASAS